MRYAIFSDVHSHNHALSEVFVHTTSRGIDSYLCLGDVGIDSSVRLVRNAGAETVFGNWEVSGWRHLSPANQAWAQTLPPMRKYADFWTGHAAPTWPETITSLQQFLKNKRSLSFQRVFPYYLQASDALWQAFGELLAANIPLFFHGHTHRQGVWELTGDNQLKQKPPFDFTLAPGSTYIVGVGSVGQPKDIPKPSYAIFDADTAAVIFMRVG